MRAEQREATRARIAAAAGELFAERGFDRTTMRAVAAEAGVDPGLVVHYFGTKRDLFRHVMGDPSAVEAPEHADATEFVLEALRAKIDDPSGQTSTHVRSMLTNPDARAHARTQLDSLATALATRLPGEAPIARAHVLLAMNLGVALARELLEVGPLRDLSAEQLGSLLRPAIEALAEGSS